MNFIRVSYKLSGESRYEDFSIVGGNLLQAFEHASDYAALLKDTSNVSQVVVCWRASGSQ